MKERTVVPDCVGRNAQRLAAARFAAKIPERLVRMIFAVIRLDGHDLAAARSREATFALEIGNDGEYSDKDFTISNKSIIFVNDVIIYVDDYFIILWII